MTAQQCSFLLVGCIFSSTLANNFDVIAHKVFTKFCSKPHWLEIWLPFILDGELIHVVLSYSSVQLNTKMS